MRDDRSQSALANSTEKAKSEIIIDTVVHRYRDAIRAAWIVDGNEYRVRSVSA